MIYDKKMYNKVKQPSLNKTIFSFIPDVRFISAIEWKSIWLHIFQLLLLLFAFDANQNQASQVSSRDPLVAK